MAAGAAFGHPRVRDARVRPNSQGPARCHVIDFLMVIPQSFSKFETDCHQVHCQSYWCIHPQMCRIQADSTSPRARMMEVRTTETRPHTQSRTTHATRNGPDPSGTTKIQEKLPTGGATCAGMLCMRGCGRRAHATCTCAPTGAAMPLLLHAAAMPRRKRITSSGSGGVEDSSSDRRQ